MTKSDKLLDKMRTNPRDMNTLEYPFLVRPIPLEDGGGWVVTYPDLPGCTADGATPEEAMHQGADAVRSWVLTAREFGDPVPEPGSTPLVAARLPRGLRLDLAGLAQHEGVNLDTLITALLAEGLGRRAGLYS